MRFLCLLISISLAFAVRLTEEPSQLLEPVAFVENKDPSTPICTHDCDRPSVDCQYSAWGDWQPCWGASACGGPYFTNRTRYVVQPAVAYGTPCNAQTLIESRACTQEEISVLTSQTDYQSRCAVPCIQSAWVVKTPCDVSQASCPARAQAPTNARIEGRVTYSRETTQQPQHGGAKCGANEKTEVCYFDCKYDCQWGPWSNDGCELPCAPPAGSPGQNRQKQTRKIMYFALNGGAQCTGESSKYEGPCANLANLPSCCPGCTEGPWTDWTDCSVSCGYGGSRRRTRVVTKPTEWYTNPAICGSAMPACGASEQTEECCKAPCAEDCVCGEWTVWSDCMTDNAAEVACGAGVKNRYRVCLPPQNGGKPCPPESEQVSCALPGCPTNCEVSEWGPFSDCPATCGVRLSMARSRTITTPPQNGGSPCPELVDERACPCTPCPEDCQLGPWSTWGECDAPCGPGKRQRTRDIIVTPKNGGLGCGTTIETSDCVVNEEGGYWENGQWWPANKPCDVNCKVGQWSEWAGCSKSCTSDEDSSYPGTRRRTRTVTTPPEYNGVPCPATVEEQWCGTQCCPVDMVLSDFGNWSPCTATCGGGWQSRSRSIVSYPRCGGRVVNESLIEYQRCNLQCCDRPCQYYPFSTSSTCRAASASVLQSLFAAGDYAGVKNTIDSAPAVACPTKSGFSYRTREVRIDNLCTPCTQTLDYRPCGISCPVDCVMEEWGAWSQCDRECGWGSQKRTRGIAVQPQGGTPCPCEEETRPCDNGPCCKDCVLTDWNEWEACSVSCGGGIQSRRRYVNMSSELCPELECKKAGLIETQSCNTQDCPADCVMEPWGQWSQCSSSCGLGFRYRTRGIQSLGNGRCEWDFEEEPCTNGPCPVPCVYTLWTEWTQCPVSCLPNNQPPQNKFKQYRAQYRISGGVDCPPVQSEEKDCDPYPPECELMCIVGAWGPWSDCSSQYGWGERRRERSVIQQPTGREICPQLYQIDRCYHEPPSNNCTWSTWGEWSQCSAPCRTATEVPSRYRERYLVRAPATTGHTQAGNGTAASVTWDLEACASTGGKVQTEPCTGIPFCPVDCIMTKWSPWTECQHPGVRHRYRHVVSQPQYGGAACNPCVSEVDHCTMKSNDLPSGECEVGKCALEVEKELEAKINGKPGAGYE